MGPFINKVDHLLLLRSLISSGLVQLIIFLTGHMIKPLVWPAESPYNGPPKEDFI